MTKSDLAGPRFKDTTLREAQVVATRQFGGRRAVEVSCPWCHATHWLLAVPGTVAECLAAPGRPLFITDERTTT